MVIVSLTVSISACYGNWPEINRVADSIDCSMSEKSIEQLANKVGADSLWDPQSSSLTLAKADDAITVVFDAKSEKIQVVAKTQSMIGTGGLVRHQGDVIIVKRCE